MCATIRLGWWGVKNPLRAVLKIQLIQRCCLHHAKLHFLIGSLGLGSIQCTRQLPDQHVCELSNSSPTKVPAKAQYQSQCDNFVSRLFQLFPFLHLLHSTFLQFLPGCLLVARHLAVSLNIELSRNMFGKIKANQGLRGRLNLLYIKWLPTSQCPKFPAQKERSYVWHYWPHSFGGTARYGVTGMGFSLVCYVNLKVQNSHGSAFGTIYCKWIQTLHLHDSIQE